MPKAVHKPERNIILKGQALLEVVCILARPADPLQQEASQGKATNAAHAELGCGSLLKRSASGSQTR